MAKKKQVVENPIFKQEVTRLGLDGLKILKVGQEVYYKTPYIAEKTTVVAVDKKTKIATLDNQVQVSMGILKDGNLLKVGYTTDVQVVRLWDEKAEEEFNFITSKKLITSLSNELVRSINNLPKDKVISIGKRFNKIKSILEDA